TDYKKSSLGRMMPTIFKKVGIDFKELNRKKRINIHKKGGYVANMVKTNNGDVGICWNAIAKLREETLDIIEIPQNQLPTPQIDAVSSATGKSFFLTPMRVTIATLKCSTNPEASKRFAEFLTSPEGSNCFCEFGFTMIKTIKLYENGKAL
ncbi:MAG: substrate-binding domain-containing protein, partial [Verrucomicrobiota bacterium]|nr:substrate-binding domain-containing protein [Verrucomicrobiota bacterium]